MPASSMPPSERRRYFPTTRWSQVVAAGASDSPAARAALAGLCETYWGPVHRYIRCTCRSDDDARDLTQAFFTRMLERGDFGNARRERGHFRAFLLTAVRHFLANQADYDHAEKRGGGRWPVPIEPASPDDRQPFEPVATTETPETIFEEYWAQTALGAALTRLAAEYKHSGREPLFRRLQPCLTGDSDAEYAESAAALGMTEGAVRVAVHRLRRRFGRCLRQTLADTVNDPADVDAELAYLLKVVSRSRRVELNTEV